MVLRSGPIRSKNDDVIVDQSEARMMMLFRSENDQARLTTDLPGQLFQCHSGRPWPRCLHPGTTTRQEAAVLRLIPNTSYPRSQILQLAHGMVPSAASTAITYSKVRN